MRSEESVRAKKSALVRKLKNTKRDYPHADLYDIRAELIALLEWVLDE